MFVKAAPETTWEDTHHLVLRAMSSGGVDVLVNVERTLWLMQRRGSQSADST